MAIGIPAVFVKLHLLPTLGAWTYYFCHSEHQSSVTIVKKQYNETSNIIFYHTAAATTSGTIRIATAFSLDQHRGMCTISVTQYCMKLKQYENSQLTIIDQVRLVYNGTNLQTKIHV